MAKRFTAALVATLAFFIVVLSCASPLVNAADSKAKSASLPSLETVLAQDFQLSVTTISYGTFNATLRVKGSLNFPDRLHGELIPRGTPILRAGQQALDCFSRQRDFTDDKYAPALSPSVTTTTGAKDKKDKTNAGSEEREKAEAAMGVERPTLLAFDIKLHHPNSPRGTVSVYYLPADKEAMVEARESFQEGAVAPILTAAFLLRPERSALLGTIISSVPGLAGVASGALFHGKSESEKAKAGEAGEEAGDFTLRLFSEHEFSLELHLPVRAQRERVWVYGYTQPSDKVFARQDNERAWWHLPAMLAIGSLTSIIQVLTGVKDGTKKAAERKALEKATAEQRQLKGKKKD